MGDAEQGPLLRKPKIQPNVKRLGCYVPTNQNYEDQQHLPWLELGDKISIFSTPDINIMQAQSRADVTRAQQEILK